MLTQPLCQHHLLCHAFSTNDVTQTKMSNQEYSYWDIKIPSSLFLVPSCWDYVYSKIICIPFPGDFLILEYLMWTKQSGELSGK